MGKVFIVSQGEYSDYRIMAVFSNMEQAIYYAALHNDPFDDCNVEEYELDEVTIDSPPEMADKWMARIAFDGHLESFFKADGYHTMSPPRIDFNPYYGGRYIVKIFVPVDTPFDKVKKILFDTFAKWKYEQMEVTP